MAIRIRIQAEGKEFYMEAEPGRNLLELLREAGIYVDAPCGGRGTCGRCTVWVDGEETPACRVRVNGGCTVRVPGERRMEGLAYPGEAPEQRRAPSQSREWRAPSHPGERRALSHVGKAQERMETPSYSGNVSGKAPRLGLAADIGTTTLAAALVSLETGEVLAAHTEVNHQRSWGADVISRIQAANEGKGALLMACIRKDLQRMAAELCRRAGARLSDIRRTAVVGNTTMCHLLRGLSCRTLGEAPFTPVDIGLHRVRSGGAEAVILPGISAFVGADITAGIYACGMARREETALLLDIGTNGEMAIGNRDGMLVTSAAAGPVFEGGGISCGMPGVPGAISHVRLAEEHGRYEARCETIENGPPEGLCGTGIIDVMAEFLRIGAVDENGTLADPWFAEGFALAKGIRFRQEDIRQFQMGKAAIRAGIETLLAERGMPEQVFLAGGFGCFLDEKNAIATGLFPECFAGRIRALGNGALSGAVRFLTDADGADTLADITAHAQEINLAMHEKFNERYLGYLLFQ